MDGACRAHGRNDECVKRCSLVNVVIRLRAGQPGFSYRQEQGRDIFSLCQTSSEAHSVFCLMVNGGFSPGNKAAGT
jgi:hypothetical protein